MIIIPEAAGGIKLTFNVPETSLWTLNSAATIVSVAGATELPNSLKMTWGFTDPTSNRTVLGLTQGRVYPTYVRVNFDGVPSSGVALNIQYDGLTGGNFFVAKDTAGGSGWRLKLLGNIRATNIDRLLTCNGTHNPAVLGVAYVNAFYIGYQALPETYLPINNGQRGVTWQTWHEDDIMGTPMPRGEAVRDRNNRLVDVFQGLDESAHDEIIQNPRPTERHRRDP